MDHQVWLSTREFADEAGISPQRVRAALRRALAGKTWRGQQLQVRRTVGRGGKAGVGYEVRLPKSQDELRPEPRPGDPLEPALPRTVSAQDQSALDKLITVQEVLRHPSGSAARSEAAHRAAADRVVSVRTIYRWVARFEQHGIRGLGRSRAPTAAQRRVVVSRTFDDACRQAGMREEDLWEIAGELDKALKGLWASRAEQAGTTEVRRLAEFLLVEICESRGVTVPTDAVRLSRRRVERFAHYRVINQRRNDRKAFDDAKPRIRRDWTGLQPMQRVIADVKHLDVIVRRRGGSPAWPKIVAFMDAGVGRLFVHPVLCDRGESVRQEHVIEAFLAMVSDPSWGFPQGLYLDNGVEFGALKKIDGALQLLNEPGARTVIFAQPYNASAKPIESRFARLDRYVFSLLPGYAGPNRMAKKTQTVGKPPKPYPGDWDDFCTTLKELVRAYNQRPVGGLWRDRSPKQWLQEKLASGWRPAAVDPLALDAAFADTDSRRVDRGVLKINGRRYTHEALWALPSRTVVDLALPWRRGAPPLAKLNGAWIYLSPEVPVPASWIEGARESRRRQASQTRHVAAMARDAPVIDPVETKIRWSRQFRRAEAPPPLPEIDLGAEVRLRARSIPNTAESSHDLSPAELRRAREMRLTERLEARQRDE